MRFVNVRISYKLNKIIAYIFLLSLTLVLGDRYLINSVASQNIPTNQPLQFTPPDNGAPGGDRSGSSANTGSRDDCPAVEKPITALIPKSNWGNTLSDRPTLWFYIPHKQGRLTLIIKDENTTAIVARASYEVTKGGGIMAFAIPKTAPALEVNRTYRWQVYFNCKPNIQPAFTKIQGVVQRVAISQVLKTKLTSANTIQERINFYANQGLWYETITEIVNSRRSNPTDKELKQNWQNLLANSNVSLENFVSEPLVECCKYISK